MCYHSFLYLCASYLRKVLSQHNSGPLHKIEKVQHRFTKIIFCSPNVSYEVRLLLLKLDSLFVRRIKQDLCYEIINGLVAIDCSKFFSLNECNRTCKRNFKIYIQNCRRDVPKYSFATKVCHVWNTSSLDVVNAFSISSFKCKPDAVNLYLYICNWNCNQVVSFYWCGHSSVFCVKYVCQISCCLSNDCSFSCSDDSVALFIDSMSMIPHFHCQC